MKSRAILISSALLVIFTASVFAAKVKLEGVKCIMNPKAKAKAEKFVSYKGAKVYFCCDGCPKKFDAKKHATKANHQLLATGQFKQKACPLTGRKLNPKMVVKVGGVDVQLCCGGCKGKVSKAAGAKQAELVFNNKAFDKHYVSAVKKEKKDKK